MMSARLPDWMAAVMRGCRSLALMNSNCTSAPRALEASGACRLSSTSASGMKSTHRTMCSLVPCAKAGARPAAVSATTAPVPCRNVRRLIADVVIGLPLVDLLQLGLGPLHGVLGQLRVLAVLHDGVRLVQEEQIAARGAGRQRRVVDVLPQRLALFVLDLVLLPLGHDVDRGAVEGGRDLAGVEGAVVVGVVPRQPALVAALLPERLHELHGLQRALAVEHDLLAALVGLGAAVRPQHRVGEGRRVAEGVAERLTVRLALLLHHREELAGVLPGLGVLVGARFLEPGAAVTGR